MEGTCFGSVGRSEEGRKEVQTPAPSSMALTEWSMAPSASVSQGSGESVHRGARFPLRYIATPANSTVEANFLPVGMSRTPVPLSQFSLELSGGWVLSGRGALEWSTFADDSIKCSGHLSGDMNEPARPVQTPSRGCTINIKVSALMNSNRTHTRIVPP